MYPLKCTPIVKTMIWGEESWQVSCRADAMSVIENGKLAGKTLADAGFSPEKFPLLVKIIHARDALSVQVHPGDEYVQARGNTGNTGKSELWYILEPPTDGEIILGLKEGTTRKQFEAAIANGTVESCLNRKKVARGDTIRIPAGLVHALTPGTVVAEIQQNSDITYRLYDFGRVDADGNPRKLHIEDALAVINFGNAGGGNLPFVVEVRETSGIYRPPNIRRDIVYICLEGSAIFSASGETVRLDSRESILVPAKVYDLMIEGNATILKAEPICPPPHSMSVKERP